MWNTNQSCTIDSGRVINYLLNYIGKKEVTSKDVARAIRDASKHFAADQVTTVMKLIKRAVHRPMLYVFGTVLDVVSPGGSLDCAGVLP